MAEQDNEPVFPPALQAEIDRYREGPSYQEWIDLTDKEVERRAIVLTKADSVGNMGVGAPDYWAELDRRIAKAYAKRLDTLTKWLVGLTAVLIVLTLVLVVLELGLVPWIRH